MFNVLKGPFVAISEGHLSAALLILAKPRPVYNYIEISMHENLPVRMS